MGRRWAPFHRIDRVDIETNLTEETVAQAAPADPVCVEPSVTVGQVLERLKEQSAGSILICRDGALVGIFTERDALRLMARAANDSSGEGDAAWRQTLAAPIESVMVRSPATIGAKATVADAIQKMSAGGYRRLPIIDDRDRPVGMVQTSGIVHYLVQHFPKAIYNQPPVAHHVMQQREGS